MFCDEVVDATLPASPNQHQKYAKGEEHERHEYERMRRNVTMCGMKDWTTCRRTSGIHPQRGKYKGVVTILKFLPSFTLASLHGRVNWHAHCTCEAFGCFCAPKPRLKPEPSPSPDGLGPKARASISVSLSPPKPGLSCGFQAEPGPHITKDGSFELSSWV
jgi:hypothetical protein